MFKTESVLLTPSSTLFPELRNLDSLLVSSLPIASCIWLLSVLEKSVLYTQPGANFNLGQESCLNYYYIVVPKTFIFHF